MISRFRKLSLPIKLTVTFLVFVLMPIYITQIVLYFQYKNNMDSVVKDYLIKSYEKSYESVNNKFSDLVNASTYFTLSSEFNSIIHHNYSGMDRLLNEDIAKMDKMFDFAQSITKLNNIYFTLILNDSRVFGNWGTLPIINENDSSSQWLNNIRDRNIPVSWDVLNEPFFNGSSKFKPPLISVLRNIDNDKGLLILSIEQSVITEFMGLSKFPDGNLTTIIYDNDNKIIYENNNVLSDDIPKMMPDILKTTTSVSVKMTNKGGYYIISRGLGVNGWTLVQIINESQSYNNILYVRNRFMIISIVFLIMFIGVTFAIAFGTTRSIKKLGTAMKKFGEGDLGVEIEITGSDEIVELTQRFNKMVKQIEYLIGELKENERQKTQIYYESLIAQINPHFLYNTLNSIKWAASLSNAPNVVNLIISLGALLEASTSRRGDIVTLEQEIEYVKHYMNLQYARYGERIRLHFNIPTEANNLLIPKFIIQPIVENAIIHAFDQFELKGDIYIQVVLHKTFLLLLIKDNGKGISYERTMEILNDNDNSNKPNNSTKRMGIGISSVHKRIQILYGANYGLIFSTEIGSGTTFRLKLPLCYKQDD